jgi:ParB family chromosome partitioning protein
MSLLRPRSPESPSQSLARRLKRFTEMALDEATVPEGPVLGRGAGNTPLLSRLQASRRGGIHRAFHSLLSTGTGPALPAIADPPRRAPASRADDGQRIQWLRLTAIRPRSGAGRTALGPGQVEQLAASIRAVGLVDPLIVRPADPAAAATGSEYVLIAGERRRLAAERAGLVFVPAIVRSVGALQALEQALLADLHHVPLPPLDRARAYRQLLDDGLGSVAEIAARCGVSPAEIESAVGLLDLEDDIAASLTDGRLTRDQALELAQVQDRPLRQRLWRRTLRHGWSPDRMRSARARWAVQLNT